MKLFATALIASLAAADDWAPKAECLTYLDEQARWLAPRSGVVFAPKGSDDWDQRLSGIYDGQIAALKDAPAGDLSDANRAAIRQILEGLDWVNLSGADITLSSQNGWPVYDGDFATDCVAPDPDRDCSLCFGDIENEEFITGGASFGMDDNGLNFTARTGWKKWSSGADAGFIYQIYVNFRSFKSWNGQSGNALAMIFANDREATGHEYNEFNIVNSAQADGSIKMHFKRDNLGVGTNLVDLTGYAPFDDNRTYTVTWSESRGNWAKSSRPYVDYDANRNYDDIVGTGFWEIVLDSTFLMEGQNANEETIIMFALQKKTTNGSFSRLGSQTDEIKAGGKIDGRVCYKIDVTADACNVGNNGTIFLEDDSVLTFKWAAEPVIPDDSGADGDNEDDSATAMAAYGASILAAISSLAF